MSSPVFAPESISPHEQTMPASERLAEGLRLHNAGHLASAERYYQSVLDAGEANLTADALHLLGIIAHQSGRQDIAQQRIREAIRQRPDQPMFHVNLGNVLQELGHLAEAAESYRQAIAWQADFFWAWNNLANVLSRQERPEEALSALERALEIDPDSAQAWSNFGSIQRELGALDKAITACCKALELDKQLTEAWFNLGNALTETGEFSAAGEAYRTTGMLAPNHPQLQANWALLNLAEGSLEEGWRRYEQRWNKPEIGPRHHAGGRPWQGENLAGKNLCIWGEQGIGDEILFASLLPDVLHDVARDGGRCVVECDKRLLPLFARSFPEARLVGHEERPAASDFQIALGSLPLRYRRSVADFPTRSSYLKADPQKTGLWRKRLAACIEARGQAGAPVIGLSWRSLRQAPLRSRHYMTIQDMAPLLAQPGYAFVNLQYGDCAAELDWARRELGVEILAWPDLDLTNDLDDVAALITGLDQVVAPDNTVGALAGALGRPTWHFGLDTNATATLGTNFCPWYPTVRIAHRHWDEPWSVVTDALIHGLAERQAAKP